MGLKIKNFVFEHRELFTVLGLCILFYFTFFHNLGTYALMDVDESRYVSMSKEMYNKKDFLTLHLNNEYFFEKPPLYFWGECLSFVLFGKITEFTARFPAVLCGTFCVFLTYFIGRKTISGTYGLISALVLGSSLEFLILSKFAILDITVTFCIWFSLCFGMMTEFCKEKDKKYFWMLFYLFSGLAVMAKGIPGFVIPFGSIFFIKLFSNSLKEALKPRYFVTGIILFLLVVLPWHIIMMKLHNPLFFNEYIIKHHLSRFLGSNELGRQEPFYFYFLTLLWGFFPWVISCVPVLVQKIRNFHFENFRSTPKFIIYNAIIAVLTLTFFSLSKTKLITYILPAYPPLACLGGYVWMKYIQKGEQQKLINCTVYILGGVLIFASIAACLSPLFLPAWLSSDIACAKPLCVITTLLAGIISIIFAYRKKYWCVFFSYVLFPFALSAFGTDDFFNIDYKFGQSDLLKYAAYAQKNNKTITCYGFSHKYSLIYYGGKPVEFGKDYGIEELEAALNKPDNLVIIPYRKIDDEVKNTGYRVLEKGRKYILTEGIR